MDMPANRRSNEDGKRLDDAARAGWLYYVAGKRQDDIARILGVSRQSAQRLVSLAVSSGIVKVRIEHPIARCMDLAQQLRERFGLQMAEVVPADPAAAAASTTLAVAGAAVIERYLQAEEPAVFAIGTGRTLKSAIDMLPELSCPHHRIVSLAGNIAPDGSASFYNVIFTLADKTQARSFPIALPVVASSAQEREMLHRQPLVAATLALAQEADVAFVGVGDLGEKAPLHIDGFVTRQEISELEAAGAVGEICGWAFDAAGKFIANSTNSRVSSGTLPSTDTCLVIGLAGGARKLPGIRAAMKGKIINGLVTDEPTAEALLNG